MLETRGQEGDCTKEDEKNDEGRGILCSYGSILINLNRTTLTRKHLQPVVRDISLSKYSPVGVDEISLTTISGIKSSTNGDFASKHRLLSGRHPRHLSETYKTWGHRGSINVVAFDEAAKHEARTLKVMTRVCVETRR